MDERNPSRFKRQLVVEFRFAVALIAALLFLSAVGRYAIWAGSMGTSGAVLLVLGLVVVLALIGRELWLFWLRFSGHGERPHSP